VKRTLFALLALSAPCFSETPEAIAQQYLTAMSEMRIEALADTMHPAALDRFKQILGQVSQAISAIDPEKRPNTVIRALFGDDGPDAVLAEPPREVFVRFMANLTTFVPQIREMQGGSEHEIIGHVDEGGNLCHVVFRATLKRGSTGISKMAVLSLKRDGTSWKVLLDDDLAKLITGLGQRMGTPEDKP
jgi:hypothetical protein